MSMKLHILLSNLFLCFFYLLKFFIPQLFGVRCFALHSHSPDSDSREKKLKEKSEDIFSVFCFVLGNFNTCLIVKENITTLSQK